MTSAMMKVNCVYSSATMATSSTTGLSSETMTTSVSIKQEVIDNDSLSSAVGGSGEAAAVAAAAAAAAAVVRCHFGLGLTSSPSAAVAGRRSTLGYSSAAAGARTTRMHSTAQPETCVCEVSQNAIHPSHWPVFSRPY